MRETYKVEILPEAENDYLKSKRWYLLRDPLDAISWTRRIDDALLSLRSNPQRCSVAPEAAILREEIRCLLCRSGGERIHRILFRIKAGKVVEVLRIRHSRQRRLVSLGNSEVSGELPTAGDGKKETTDK